MLTCGIGTYPTVASVDRWLSNMNDILNFGQILSFNCWGRIRVTLHLKQEIHIGNWKWEWLFNIFNGKSLLLNACKMRPLGLT